MGVWELSAGLSLRFAKKRPLAGRRGRFLPIRAWWPRGRSRVRSVFRQGDERAWWAGGGWDPRTGELEEDVGRKVSGVSRGATDLGRAYGDRDTGVLTRIKKLKEDGNRSGFVKI